MAENYRAIKDAGVWRGVRIAPSLRRLVSRYDYHLENVLVVQLACVKLRPGYLCPQIYALIFSKSGQLLWPPAEELHEAFNTHFLRKSIERFSYTA
jgi:hypothetical protein